jgi:hypothetical protein
MDGIKGSVYDYLLFVFDLCLANYIKIILRNFDSKIGREDNFRATVGYYSARIMTMQLNSKLRHIHNLSKIFHDCISYKLTPTLSYGTILKL